MERLGVIANCSKPRAAEVLARLEQRAVALGLKLVACKETAQLLSRPEQALPPEEVCSNVDVVLALGGDGTMLRVVRALQGSSIPVLGVNIGSLGFLTSVAEKDLDRALTCLHDDDYSTSVRSVALCDVLKGGTGVEAAQFQALNDVVVHTGRSLRVVTLNVSIDEEEVTSYICDGLIISTPTGSTGHAMSTGGPIVHPATRAFIITPICSHALSVRPLVIPDASAISIRVAESSDKLTLSIDGQIGQSLVAGDRLAVRRGAHDVAVVHLPNYSYFSLLRQKLGWRGSSV